MKATKTRWEMKTARFLPPVGYTSSCIQIEKNAAPACQTFLNFCRLKRTSYRQSSLFALLRHVSSLSALPLCSNAPKGDGFVTPPIANHAKTYRPNQIKTTIPPSIGHRFGTRKNERTNERTSERENGRSNPLCVVVSLKNGDDDDHAMSHDA